MGQGQHQRCMMYQMADTVHYQACQMKDMDIHRWNKIVWHICISLRKNGIIFLINNYYNQNGNTICGGEDVSAGKTCIQLIDGQWSTSHQLKTHREHHCSWTSLNGDVLIIGINKQTKVNLIYVDYHNDRWWKLWF